ncbi:hypothetical protein MJN54_34755, partial [Salmonella enterica subsp. enterica serovar Kentucky]|nr:hypothetical protein [Salmonella enterica subsp. enterica serovar Kentucky]
MHNHIAQIDDNPVSRITQAEITVLKQDPQAGNPLSRLNFTVGGSIRPQFQNMTGNDGA